MATLTGTIERTIYRNPENGWAVLLISSNGQGTLSCVGNILEAAYEGLDFEFSGDWANDPQYGRQFKFTSYQMVRPTSSQGIQRYLASGVIDGIGPGLAARIVGKFGEETLDVLDTEPGRLSAIEGIGRKKLQVIREQWQAQTVQRQGLVWLMSLGVSMGLAVKIIRHFTLQDQEPQAAVAENPYCLTELWGVGFLKADAIARKLGFGLEHPARLRAGLTYTLQEARDRAGHCYLPDQEAREKTAELCRVPTSLVADLEKDLATLTVVVRDQDRLYLPITHHQEVALARGLGRLAETTPRKREWWAQERLQDAFEREVGFQLTQEQIEAVYALLGTNLGVLTGGPGVGKTQVTRALVMLAEGAGMKVELASPTGRAAKRLEELARHEARTMHRLLKWSPDTHTFLQDVSTPLVADLVIVDEASMVDLTLAYALVSAIDPRFTQLLFVGDKDQLPSVGPGSVLNDLIVSRRARVCQLTQIMRQAEGSAIIVDAHNVNAGRSPALASSECWWSQADDPERIRMEILRIAAGHEGELQILSPMRKGPVGTVALNQMLQEALNPAQHQKPEIHRGRGDTEIIYRLGDRVIQTKNDYDRGVMNGDIGEIVQVDEKDKEVAIRFADALPTYGPDDLRNVDLAYALTIHKAQGSEYPMVVIVACWGHHIMLQRNLLYTALTRAQERVVVVGEKRAIQQMVRNNTPSKRYTGLRERLKEAH